MKRKLALFLALVMILSLVPANVFAASSNSVNKTPSVDTDTTFDETTGPVLRIEESNDGEFGTSTETFQLTLENADWDLTEAAFEALMETEIEANWGGGGSVDVTVERISDTKMSVEYLATPGTDNYFLIPLVTAMDSEGAAKVTVDPKDSPLSAGTYTFANVSDGATTTIIEDTVDFQDTIEIETITIEENVIGTFTDGEEREIKLKLIDSDFSWEVDEDEVTLSGGFDSSATIDYLNNDGDAFDNGENENILVITIDDMYASSPTARGTITIAGLEIDPDSGADFGEVKVKIYGDNITTETLVIGNYVDYDVTVEADEDDDMPTIYAGKISEDTSIVHATLADTTYNENVIAATDSDDDITSADATDDSTIELATLIIDEAIEEAWLVTRTTIIEFPDWVEIVDIVVESDTSNLTDFDEDDLDWAIGDNKVELDDLVWDGSGEVDVWLTFFVSVEADAEGDIVASVSGSSLQEDHEVKLGEAVAPAKIDIEVADVRLGLQDQEVGTITIVEPEAELWASGREIVLSLESEIEFASTPTVTVVEGDITIDSVDKDGSTITIVIDDESTEASTIEITGLEVDVDRTVEEGDFNIAIGGNALVMNYQENGDQFRFETDAVVDTAFVRVITPADSDVQAAETVSFTIDAMEYKIGETVVSMDAAPFIDASNRTMLPLRSFSNALGVTDENILWNGTERSVTIFKGDRVVKVVIGEMSFMINGVNVPMDTTAVIKDSRTFLPVRALGQALGAQIGWDAATRTVTID